ncbi:MAG: metal ABC transporter permease [Rhodobacteraceae bacterium]|nr:metal ABC transporter permease [Paracoccaceae bacterium]
MSGEVAGGLLALLADHTVGTVAAGAAILGAAAGVVGSFALLRRQSLYGDVLAHAALPGLCLGFIAAGARVLPALMAGAALTGVAAALAALALARTTRLKADAAQGIVLATFFAFGLVLLTWLQGRGTAGQAGLASFLFGQAAGMLRSDLWQTGGLAALAVGLVALFWKEAKLVAFDPVYAATTGLPVAAIETGLTLLVAVAVLVGLQLVGVVLITALIVAPAAAARQWTDRLGRMVALAALFGALAGVTGTLVSATARGLATGPLIVLAASAVVAVSLLAAPGRGLLWQGVAGRASRRRLAGERVLATLAELAESHADPAYRAEEGMLDAALGTPSGPALGRLAAAGLVRAVAHPPEDTAHWQLTAAGLAAARRRPGERGPGR